MVVTQDAAFDAEIAYRVEGQRGIRETTGVGLAAEIILQARVMLSGLGDCILIVNGVFATDDTAI